MLSRSGPSPALLRDLDSVLGSLRRGGFPLALAARAFSLLGSYIYGFAVPEAALPFDTPAELAELTGSIMGGLRAEDYPHLVEMGVEGGGRGLRSAVRPRTPAPGRGRGTSGSLDPVLAGARPHAGRGPALRRWHSRG